MSMLPSLLLGLLTLCAGAPPAAASMTTSIWYHAQVSQNQLTAVNTTSKSYQVLNEIICAMLATKNPWCQLFTHEGNTCVLYDVLVDSLADPPSENTVTPCKSCHRNVCIVEGTLYHHGDTLDHKCIDTTCWNRALVSTYPVSSTCDAPFSPVNIGCVHLTTTRKDWCEARRYCASLEADLAVVPLEFYSELQAYIYNNVQLDSAVWVGIRENKWLDGRLVVEWGNDAPHNWYAEAGGIIWYEEEDKDPVLIDDNLTTKHYVLCKRT